MTRLAKGTQFGKPLHLRGTIVSELDIPKAENRRWSDVYFIQKNVNALHDMGLCNFTPGRGTCYTSDPDTLTFVGITDLREYFRAGDILYVIVEEEKKGNWRKVGYAEEVLDGPYQVATVGEATIQFTANLSDEVQTYDSEAEAKKFRVFRTPETIIPQKKNIYTSDIKKAAADEAVWVDGSNDLTNDGTSLWNTAGDFKVEVGDWVTLSVGNHTQTNEVETVSSNTQLVMADPWSASIQSALEYDTDAVETFTIYRPLSVYVDTASDPTAKTIKAVEDTAKFNTAGSFKIEVGDEVFIEVMDLNDPENVTTHWLRGTVATVADDQTFTLENPISDDETVLALFNEIAKATSTFGVMRFPGIYLTDAGSDAKTLINDLGAFAGWNTFGENQILAGDKVEVTVVDENGVYWTLQGFVASITDDEIIELATKISQDEDLSDLLDGASNASVDFVVKRFDTLTPLTLEAGKLLLWTPAGWKQV